MPATPTERERCSLLAEVSHGANLAAAFARYQRYRGLWSPGVPMARVSAAPVRPMLELAEELHSGSYQPATPCIVPVTKGDGTCRRIAVYPIRDRVAQRAMLQVLQEKTEPRMPACSFGFRPGLGVAHAVAAVRRWLDCGYRWVVDTDIETCFDSVPRAALLREVERRAGAESAGLVATMLGWSGTPMGTGIPQGAVLSPWLCNVYLWPFDEAVQRAALPLVRYADDFVVLAATESLAQAALRYCRATLEALSLRLHPRKTRVHCEREFRFLGAFAGATPLLPLCVERLPGSRAC